MEPAVLTRTIAYAVAAALVSPALILLGNWSVGHLWLPQLLGNILPTLGFFAGIVLGPGLLATACVKAFRKDWVGVGAAGSATVGAVVGFLLLGSAIRVGMQLRVAGYEKLAVSMTPVIEAIRQFEVAHGRLPVSLAELSPSFLAELPRGVRRVEYVREGGSPPRELYGNKWMLWSNAGWGMGFDSFVYFPNQKYPSYMFGGGPELVRDWAYVHE